MIKSPLTTELKFERSLTAFLEKEKLGHVCLVSLTETGFEMHTYGLCGHDLQTIAELLRDKAEELLLDDKHKHD